MKLLLLNGPNLNLLGSREPGLYGVETLATIEKRAAEVARAAGHELLAFQSNAEHELIERVHAAATEAIAYIVINPGAFTHTSVALRDALLAVHIPFIEIHLSNLQRREPFRHHSYFTDVATGLIAGLGAYGYELAVQAAIRQLGSARPS